MNGWSILRGLLTGVDPREAARLGNYRNEEDIAAARARWEWCRERGIDLLRLALQFCLREQRIHGNPIGSLNAAQLEAEHPRRQLAAQRFRVGRLPEAFPAR